MQPAIQSKVNGIDAEALRQTVEAIRSHPELARFQFRARNQLVEGALNRSEVGEFHGAQTEHRRGIEPFVLHNDEPHVLLSKDQAPNPVEYVLQALLACMTTTTVYKAAAHGIEIDGIESEIEGDIDLRGLLEIDPNVPPGFQEIRATLRIRSQDTSPELREFYRKSPVFDTLTRPVPVKVCVIVEPSDNAPPRHARGSRGDSPAE